METPPFFSNSLHPIRPSGFQNCTPNVWKTPQFSDANVQSLAFKILKGLFQGFPAHRLQSRKFTSKISLKIYIYGFRFCFQPESCWGKTWVQRFWFMEIPIYSSKVFFFDRLHHLKNLAAEIKRLLTKNIRNTPWKSNMNTKNKALERGNDLFKYDNLWYPCWFFSGLRSLSTVRLQWVMRSDQVILKGHLRLPW